MSTKLEVIYLCEVSDLLKSDIGRQYGMTFLTMFTVLKTSIKYKFNQLFCMIENQGHRNKYGTQ